MQNTESDLLQEVYQDVDFAVLIQIAGRMIAQHVELIGKETGLSAGHLSVLGMILRKPGLVQNAYGTILAINDATLGRYVDKLEGHGLVQRARCDGDRRTVRLTLTQAGQDYIRTVKSRLTQVRAEVTGGLQADDISLLHEKLVVFLSAQGRDQQDP